MSDPIFEAALAYHEQRYCVLPVMKDKTPYLKWEQYADRWRREGQTVKDVRFLFDCPEVPRYGVALLAWPYSQFVALDFDGPHSAAAWEKTGIALPETSTNYSATGFPHLFFPPPEAINGIKRKIRLVTEDTPCGWKGGACGVDLICNGYIIVPPTPGYREDPDRPFGGFAELPESVIALVQADASASAGPVAAPAESVIVHGQRNDALTSIAGTMRRRGLDEEEIFAALVAVNARRCQPPLPEGEVREIAGSVARYPTSAPAAQENKPPAAVVVQLSAVAPEAVTWVWPSRIPRGKLSLIVGDPGLGKSITCLDLAARITTGGLWPDGTRAPQGNVVFLTAEDGLADTVRPRLDALGGKADCVFILKGIREGGTERGLDFTVDLPHLEALITEVRAVAAFIDPVSAYLGKTDSYRDSEVRAVLAPLAAMAEHTRAATVGVMHLTKNQQRQLIHRVQGNVAFAAAARAVFAIAEDRDTPDRRFFAAIKMNLARKPPSLAFRLEQAGAVTVVKWEPVPVDVNPESLLGPPESEETRGARDQALEFLRETLADGAVEADAVKSLAKKERISKNTLYRAKGALGVMSRKEGFDPGRWVWELPKIPNIPRER